MGTVTTDNWNLDAVQLKVERARAEALSVGLAVKKK